MLSEGELEAERLLVEASQREPRRFAGLYERYFDRVYAFALTRTRDRAAAEDLTAETFRRAFQKLAQFRWVNVPFSAWLFRIAANAAVDAQRLSSREIELPEVIVDQSSDSWEDRLIEVEQRAAVFALVERLPRQQHDVVVMRFARGMSTRDIAGATGRSEGAVKQLQFRAIQRLRKWMDERDA